MAGLDQGMDETCSALEEEAGKVVDLQMYGYWTRVEREVVRRKNAYLQAGKVEVLQSFVAVLLP